MIATPTGAERAKAKRIAANRESVKRGPGRLYKQGSLKNHEDHALAELVVARVLGGAIDTSLSVRGQKKGNLIVGTYRGTVAYRDRRGYALMLKTKTMAGFYGDFAVLVWPGENDGTLEIVGVAERSYFAAHATLRNYGHGEHLGVDSPKLQSFDKLVLNLRGFLP